MRILVVEDERTIAEDLKTILRIIFNSRNTTIHVETNILSAECYLKEHPIDLLLLDLNLNSSDGFQLLRKAVSHSFHTIVISGNTNRAIEAFEYGVLDFIPKPYSEERIRKALAKYNKAEKKNIHSLEYLSVKKGREVKVIPLSDVVFFRALNIYSEIHTKSDSIEIYDKSLKMIEKLLPDNFLRIHKSYIVNLESVVSFQIKSGGKYKMVVKNGNELPVSRNKIKDIRHILGLF